LWLGNKAVQDLIPADGYTLLRLNPAQDAGSLISAFAAIGAPLSLLDLPREPARSVYERDLLLLRPDMHVVWRDNHMPQNPAELAAIATGHGRAG
jgi:hypothetical protein